MTNIMKTSLSLVALALVACASGPEDISSPTADEPNGPPAADTVPIRKVVNCSVPAVPPADAVSVLTDQRYAEINGRVLGFDLATPLSATTPRPLIVLFHGGGFKGGSKNGLRDEIRTLASLGYAAASVDYRLSGDADYIFPAPFSDGRCALRVLSKRASELNIDKTRIAVGGTSAGGALALAIVMNSSSQLDAAMPSASCDAGSASLPAVRALVSWYGGGELRDASLFGTSTAAALAQMLGGEPSTVPSRAALVSAIAHVDRLDPPTLHLHGTDDAAVVIQQAINLDAALRAASVQSLLVSIPGVGHGFDPLSADPVLRTSTCSALQFLKDRLHP